MGARATNARWFRDTPEPQEPFDYFSQRLDVDGVRERMLARMNEFGILSDAELDEARRQIIAHLVAPPETRFERLLGELARLLGKQYVDWAESAEYVGLSTLLREMVKQDG